MGDGLTMIFKGMGQACQLKSNNPNCHKKPNDKEMIRCLNFFNKAWLQVGKLLCKINEIKMKFTEGERCVKAVWYLVLSKLYIYNVNENGATKYSQEFISHVPFFLNVFPLQGTLKYGKSFIFKIEHDISRWIWDLDILWI